MAHHLVLVLPGAEMGPDSPPLLVPTLALEQLGAHIEVVPYPDLRPATAEESVSFNKFVFGRVCEIVAQGQWDRVTFVAKSLGSAFLATMPELDNAASMDAIWVTPLLGYEHIRAGVIRKRWRSLLVAGGADPYHDSAAHAEVCESIGASSLVLDGADHGLVVLGDVHATLAGLSRLADECLRFASP